VSLHFFNMFAKFFEVGDRPQISKMANSNCQIKYIGNKIGWSSWSNVSVFLQHYNFSEALPLGDSLAFTHVDASSLVALMRVSSLTSIRDERAKYRGSIRSI
jgi:hypothetical protein